MALQRVIQIGADTQYTKDSPVGYVLADRLQDLLNEPENDGWKVVQMIPFKHRNLVIDVDTGIQEFHGEEYNSILILLEAPDLRSR